MNESHQLIKLGKSIGKAIGKLYSMIVDRLEEESKFDFKFYSFFFLCVSFLDIANMSASSLPFAILSDLSITDLHSFII
jgi:hypothetical protein